MWKMFQWIECLHKNTNSWRRRNWTLTVAPPLDMFEDGCEFWKSTLVGHFVGAEITVSRG